MSRIRAFTLIELLIVIAIIAILGSATVLILNPLELMRQGRDGTRINDTENMEKSVKLTLFNNPTLLDSLSNTSIYLSLPSGQCPSNPPTGYSYVCNASASNINKVDGTGWIPLNLQNIASLPTDPNPNPNFYYAFVADPSTKTYVITSLLESEKQLKNAALRSGGYDPSRFEKGNVSLWDKANGLVGYWPMDEGVGGTTADLSINGYTGTLTATTPSWVTPSSCKAGGCLSFNGTSGTTNLVYQSGITGPWIASNKNSMTMALWVKPTNPASSLMPVGVQNSGGGQRFYIGTNGSKWDIGIEGSGWGDTPSPAVSATSNWTHVAVVMSPGKATLYVNGVKSLEKTVSGTYNPASTVVTFGAYTTDNGVSYTYNWNGLMDDVRVYNRSLSADDVAALYNAYK